MSFKALFSRSLAADPTRLHFAAHSHHFWPDVSFAAHTQAWEDAARLADGKWRKVMNEVWPEAQAHVARELGAGEPDSIAFSSNTHDFIVRLLTAAPRTSGRLRVLTSDGEFHSARRQLNRWQEEGWMEIERIATEPFDSFSERFMAAARSGKHDMILVSHVFFDTGRIFDQVDELSALGQPDGPWVVIDGYHAFMAIESPFGREAGSGAFYLGGGYKYAMAGEGCAFIRAPRRFAPRPPITGWFAEHEDLTSPPGRVCYPEDARRFFGATFDPSGLYRFNAVQRMLQETGLTTAIISTHAKALQTQLLEQIEGTAVGEADLLNPLGDGPHARFLAFRSPNAERWSDELKAYNCITDVRRDALRIGFGIYQDEDDVQRLSMLLRAFS